MDLFNKKDNDDTFSQMGQSQTTQQETVSNQRSINYNTNYNTNYNKGSKNGCLIAAVIAGAIAAVVAVIVIVFFVFIIGSIGSAIGSVSGVSSSSSVPVVSGNYVEIIHIEGTISDDSGNYYCGGYTHKQTLDEIESLIRNDSNKGIILYIDSPGGGVYESDEMYKKLMRYKELTGRPVYAYMAATAASGGLYVSMAADSIFANRMTLTGSIGVISSAYDLSGLMDKLGIEETNIKSGANKDMVGYAGYNDEQTQIMQSIIDEYFNYFVQVISSSRGLTEEQVREIADGRVYSATQAQELGLIDGVCDYDEFMENMYSNEAFADCEFYDRVSESTSIFDMLTLNSNTGSINSAAYELYSNLSKKNQSPLEYMYSAN